MTRRRIRHTDLLRIRVLGAPAVAPAGDAAVFSVKLASRDRNTYDAHLWWIELASGRSRQLTRGAVQDTEPRLAPDGRAVAFVRTVDEQAQIWLLPLPPAAGPSGEPAEPRQLTRLPEGQLGPPLWSPCGRRLAFTFRPLPPERTRAAAERRKSERRSSPPRVIHRLRYRLEGTGYLDCRQQLWLCDARTGAVRQLTEGDRDVHSPAWSPDGRWLAFVSNRSEDPDATPWLEDIWVLALGGAQHEREPTAPSLRRLATPPGYKGGLACSPDGKWIAYVGRACREDPWVPRHDRLWVVPAGGEEQARCLTAELDATIGNTTLSDLRAAFTGAAPPLWSPDSERLYALVSGPGTAQLYEVRALPGGAPARALTEGEHDLIAFDADAARERFVLLRATATAPPELFTAELRRSEGGGAGGGGDGPVQAGSGAGGPAPQPAAPLELQPLTRVHAGWLAQLELAAPELLEVAGAGGERVQAWLLLPPGAPAGRRHPLVLSVHGGPHAQYGWTFFHEMQWLAARGYAVLYANPRGSTGRGEEFLRAIRGRWGELDYQDLMAVLEHAAARPDVDPARMAVIGGSYGGYMAAWIIGQTDRFRCAIVERAVTNLHSMFGTCDFPFSPDGYWPGNPWSEPDALLAQSPLSHAHRVRTPVLIIHSEGDLRCPIEQAEQYFVALRRNRVEAVLVRYPPESNHGLSRTGPPDLRLDRLERIAAWLARHLGPAAEGAPC